MKLSWLKLKKVSETSLKKAESEESNTLLNRVEDKYFLPRKALEKATSEIRTRLTDGDGDVFTRTSVNQTIYFDTPDMDILRDGVDDILPRFKLRIRRYAPSADKWEDVAYLELKMKTKDGLSKKVRVRIPANIIPNIEKGGTIKDSAELEKINNDISKDVFWKRIGAINGIISKYGTKKQIKITYFRRAFSSEKLRVTIDDDLRYMEARPISDRTENLITGSSKWEKVDKKRNKIYEKDHLVLEVKHTDGIPGWLEDLLEECEAKKVSFSKYNASIAAYLSNDKKESGPITRTYKVDADNILASIEGYESLDKSENLKKAPVELGGINFSGRNLHNYANQDIKYGAEVETKSLGVQPEKTIQVYGRNVSSPASGNELFHHIIKTNNTTHHKLSLSPDPEDRGVAGLMVEHYKDFPDWRGTPTAKLSYVENTGFGLGYQLYKEALKHHGKLQSDSMTSPSANRTWEKLVSDPEVQGEMGVIGAGEDRHKAEYKKLAASEDLKKAPVEYVTDPQDTHKKIPRLNDSYKLINKVTLPNGLIYQQHEKSDYMGPVHVHHLYHPNESNPVAEVITRPDEDSPMNHSVHYSQVSPDHKGKGLGKQAYLAALVHGKGVGRLISDKSLSQNAHKAWVGFKGIKGLGGKIGKYITQKEIIAGNIGKYDTAAEDTHQVFVKNKKDLDHNAMFPPVSGVGEKMAASENVDSDLKKSIHPNDFKKIKTSHDKGASMAVDALSHIAKHPAHENFLNHIVNPAESVKARKIARGSMGVASKMIHDAKSYKDEEGNKITLAQPATYMTKPYFGHMESATKSYTKTPTKGWATLATKDLLHAADMGHMAEDVQAHLLNGVPVTVHKFSETHEPHINDYQKIHPLDAQKIAVMDFLTGNNDRHSGNIMVSKEQVTDPVWGHTTHTPLLIDHERNFQYHRTQQNKFGGMDHTSTDTPANFYHNSMGVRNLLSKEARQHPEEYADDLHHWWNESAPKVKEAFNQNIQHIKDPVLRSHIENNFNQRMAHLDEHLINGNYYDMFRLKHDRNYNQVPVIEGIKPMAMPKVKVRSA